MKYEEIKKKYQEIKQYVSRTKLNFCKNENCDNKRRHNSAYCEECSKKNKV